VVVGLALVFVASLSRAAEFVLNASFALRGLTSGALLGGLLLAVFWKKGRPAPIMIGMVVSLLVMTAIEVLPKIKGVHWDGIFWPWYTLIGTTVMITTSWVVRSFLPPAVETPGMPVEKEPLSGAKEV